MSTLEKLIAQLCPNGVEYRPLGKVLRSIRTGLNPRNNFRLNEPGAKHYYVTVKEISSGRLEFSDKTDRISDDALDIIQKRSCLECGDVLLSGIGTIGRVAVVEIPTENFNCSESVYLLKPNFDLITTRYLGFVLETDGVQSQWSKTSVGSTLKGIRKETLQRIEIPLPPLSVQKEIVRMLDDMAGLFDALEEELSARKKQYEWCRERLLRTDDAEIMSLGEICDYSTKRISASSLNTHTYICVESMLQNKCGKVDAASVPELGNLIAYEKGDVLIGNIRPYLKKIWLADVDGGTNGDVLVVQRKDKNLITAEYLYYVLSSDEFFLYDMQYAKGAKMPRGDKAAIMKYSIPVPPLPVQKEIVRMLDDMAGLIDALENELAARKQQYEYYRDKLLTFKRKPEVA